MTDAMHQVLVVEDEPDIRRILRVLLESESYRVVEAETAARADVEARVHKPDLLIVDLGLPDGNGLDVIRDVQDLVARADHSCCRPAPWKTRRSRRWTRARTTT